MRGKATSRNKRETPFEIRERTFKFAVQVTELVRKMPRTLDAVEIGRQLLRSGTSIGANVEEAHGAESQRDFIHNRASRAKKLASPAIGCASSPPLSAMMTRSSSSCRNPTNWSASSVPSSPPPRRSFEIWF